MVTISSFVARRDRGPCVGIRCDVVDSSGGSPFSTTPHAESSPLSQKGAGMEHAQYLFPISVPVVLYCS